MRQNKLVLLWTVALAFMLTLFPPWSVRERERLDMPFGPGHAGEYSFILAPPFENNGRFTTKIASIDVGRLAVQYLAVALAAAFVGVLRSTRSANVPLAASEPSGSGVSPTAAPVTDSTIRPGPMRSASGFSPEFKAFWWGLLPLILVAATWFITEPKPQDEHLNYAAAVFAASTFLSFILLATRGGHRASRAGTSFSISPIGFTLCLAISAFAMSDYLLAQPRSSESRAAMAGALAGTLTFFGVLPLAISYSLWRRQRLTLSGAAVMLCVLGVVLFAATRVGRMRGIAALSAATSDPLRREHVSKLARGSGREREEASSSRLEAIHEAYRRGILPKDKQPLYDEAVKRGLLKPSAPKQASEWDQFPVVKDAE